MASPGKAHNFKLPTHLHKIMHIPHAGCRSEKVHNEVLLTHHQKPELIISLLASSQDDLPANLLVFSMLEEKGVKFVPSAFPLLLQFTLG